MLDEAVETLKKADVSISTTKPAPFDLCSIMYNGGFNETDTVNVAIEVCKTLLERAENYGEESLIKVTPEQIDLYKNESIEPFGGKYRVELPPPDEDTAPASLPEAIRSVGELMRYMLSGTAKEEVSWHRGLSLHKATVTTITKCFQAKYYIYLQDLHSDLCKLYVKIKLSRKRAKFYSLITTVCTLILLIIIVGYVLWLRNAQATVTTMLTLAHKYEQTYRYTEARWMYREYITENPEDVSGRLQYANFELTRNNREECANQLKELEVSRLTDNNDRYFYYCLQGQLKEALGEWEDALLDYDNAIVLVQKEENITDAGRLAYFKTILLCIERYGVNVRQLEGLPYWKAKLKEIVSDDTLVYQYVEVAERYAVASTTEERMALYEDFFACLYSKDDAVVTGALYYLLIISDMEKDFTKKMERYQKVGEALSEESLLIFYADTLFNHGISLDSENDAYRFYIGEASDFYEKLLDYPETQAYIYVNLAQIKMWDKKFTDAESVLATYTGTNDRLLIKLAEIHLEVAKQSLENPPNYDRLEQLYDMAYGDIHAAYENPGHYENVLNNVLAEVYDLMESGLINVRR